jgi:hypothetical protein
MRLGGSLIVLKQEEGELLPVDAPHKQIHNKDEMRASNAIIGAVLQDYSYLIESV